MYKRQDSDSSSSSSSDSDSSDSDSSDNETETKAKEDSEVQKSSSSSKTASPEASVPLKKKEHISAGVDELKPGQRKHFSRVDRSVVSFEDGALTDNTYKGAAGTWGEVANEKLGRVRGKDFTKNKNKMKRGSYRGGSITLSSGSYKFTD